MSYRAPFSFSDVFVPDEKRGREGEAKIPDNNLLPYGDGCHNAYRAAFFMILSNNHAPPPLVRYPYHLLPHTILDPGQKFIRLVGKVLGDGEDVNICAVALGSGRKGRCRMFVGYDSMLLIVVW
jgi:hypothetical protein